MCCSRYSSGLDAVLNPFTWSSSSLSVWFIFRINVINSQMTEISRFSPNTIKDSELGLTVSGREKLLVQLHQKRKDKCNILCICFQQIHTEHSDSDKMTPSALSQQVCETWGRRMEDCQCLLSHLWFWLWYLGKKRKNIFKEKQEIAGPRLCSVLTAERKRRRRRRPPKEKVLRFGEKRQQLRKWKPLHCKNFHLCSCHGNRPRPPPPPSSPSRSAAQYNEVKGFSQKKKRGEGVSGGAEGEGGGGENFPLFFSVRDEQLRADVLHRERFLWGLKTSPVF